MSLNVIITGSSGMVGKGVLLECLESPDVDSVLIINRTSIKLKHEKLKEIILADFFDLSSIEKELEGFDACFFCLGVSSLRMSEDDYTRITYDLTMNFAKVLLRLNRNMVFCYVSGAGTDSSEKRGVMWARVKGKTENALLRLGFRKVYMFRPGYIQPVKGVRTKTKLYAFIYALLKPFYPVMKTFFEILTTELIGKAMINVSVNEYQNKILEKPEIYFIGNSEEKNEKK